MRGLPRRGARGRPEAVDLFFIAEIAAANGAARGAVVSEHGQWAIWAIWVMWAKGGWGPNYIYASYLYPIFFKCNTSLN